MATRISASVRPYTLTERDRHLVTRFSFGVDEQLTAAVRAAGGAERWFATQLTPTSVADPSATVHTWWPRLGHTPARAWAEVKSGRSGAWQYGFDLAQYSMVQKILTRRQLQEVLHDVWSNLLYVPVGHDRSFPWRFHYDQTLRGLALTSYRQLLRAAVVHPAMSGWLNNDLNTKRGINENLGRELLELHTVGVGHYTEDDVKASARILTGYRVDVWRTWAATYKPEDHWTGPVRVGDFVDANAAADGRDLVRRYLVHLAHHPQTAQRLARKLAVKFVRDDPPQALVDRLARTYLQHDTAIVPVLRELVRSVEFKGSRGVKLRDPSEDLVATYRALSATVRKPQRREDAANAMLWQSTVIGLAPMTWPRPDGQPLDNQAWATPARALASMDIHWSLAGGWWPKTGVDYLQPTDWVPELPMRFAPLVDHLSRRILGRPSTRGILKAASTAVGVEPTEEITADHPLMRWHFNRLLGSFLDNPLHYGR